ncbi:MAG: PHP domain-containing protein [Armatimonadota bacterium]
MRLLSLLVLLMLQMILVLPLRAAEAPLDLKGVRVLVCAGYMDLLNIPAVQRLKAAGAEVRQGKLEALTWDILRPYHLVIALGQLSSPEKEVPPAAAEALERFVKAGGGLLFYRHYYYSEKVDGYLRPFGASMPWEIIQDPAHAYTHPLGMSLPYAYTDRVTAGHPVTEGVKGLWYSAGKEFLVHTSPLTVSKDWTVLATGMPEAASMWVGGLHEEHLSKPGKYKNAPPIIAAREYGAGAIVLIGISPMEVFYGQGLPAYGDIAMEKGNGLRPSGLRRLYENSLRWLTIHAKAAAELGQGELQPLVNGWARESVPDWVKLNLTNDTCTKPARGVVGLHSNLSDGKATPQALIAKAKASGLQWVAFTERLEDISPSKWEQLRKICKEASTPDFAALPGWDYQDNSGTRYVVYGDFNWPPDKVFSEDKKRIVSPIWWFNIGTPPNGPYNLTNSPLRYWDLSMYNVFPVRTTIAGKTVEDEVKTLTGYRHVQGVHDDPFPMAVEMVYDEGQLAAAAGRMCNYIMRDQPGDVAKFYRDHMYYSSYVGFISDGPLVTDWRAYNETRVTGGKWWLPGTEQYRVKLAVNSTSPITDIKIYDGPVLARRFRPNTAKVSLIFDMPHDQQHQLYAEITDAAGKRAITGGLSIRDWLNFRFMCADRSNSICDAIQVDETGAYLTGPTASYQRKMTPFGICPGYGERHFNILPPDFDGGMRPVGLHVTPWFRIPDFTFTPPNTTLEARMEVPVSSRDGILQDDTITGYFPGTAEAWNNKPAPKDIDGVHIRYRYLDITPRAHAPGVVLLESYLTFDRALTLNHLNLFQVFHTSQPGEGDHYALHTPEFSVSGVTAPEAYSTSADAPRGSYACVFPSAWGSSGVITLDDGMVLGAHAKAPGVHINMAMGNMPRQVKAGETLAYRFVLLRGRRAELPNTADWDSFIKLMGIRGKPGYTVTAKVGQVNDTNLLLELVPQDGGFLGTVTYGNLPIRLPVRVMDMNPHWTFAWFDLDRKEWYPSAIDSFIKQGYFTLDTRRGAHRFFAGHPVLADNPDARIAVFSDAKSEVRASLNNVGDAPMNLTVRLNPALGAAPPQQVALAPGELKTVTFAFTP